MKYILRTHPESLLYFLVLCLGIVGIPIALYLLRKLPLWFPPPEELEDEGHNVEDQQRKEADTKPGSLEQRYEN